MVVQVRLTGRRSCRYAKEERTMTSEIDGLKADVAATARMMAAARLVEGFGHSSARLPGGGFLMTSTSPLLSHTAGEVLTCDNESHAVDAPAGKPLEIAIHAGIYRARPDVGAICRGHGAAMAAWGVRGEPVPLLHGMGGLAGEVVPVHDDLALITTLESGDRMAATLGDNRSMLLLANGGVAVGADLLEAATRLWYLEERCRVAVEAGPVQRPEGAWAERLSGSTPELVRAKAWFAARFGDG
jgi:ribulose-5-phosphate 4-epimerase/fuculose-1-phosphate aldolase